MPKHKDIAERWLVVTDEHTPFHDPAVWSCVNQAIAKVKPTGYINLGDFWEGESVSSWQWKKKKRPPLDVQLESIDAELVECNALLDERDAVLKKAKVKKKWFCQGNHDEWIDRLVEENPYLERTESPRGKGYLFKDAFDLQKRGYKFFPIGEYAKIGKLYLYHGHHFATVNHARNHLLKTGVSIMYGHHHDVQEASITHVDGAKSAWSIGCGKGLNHDSSNQFLGRRNHNWGHAFAVVDFWDGGYFTVHVIRVINGKCSLWGEVIDGTR